MEELNKVHHMDWLENNLPDKCANLIIADPPYFEVKGEFDFIWDSFDDYLQDVERWAQECARLLAENGTLFWWGNAKKIAYAQIIFDKYLNLENHVVWNKGSFMGLEKSEGLRSFAPCTERILMYSQDELNLTGCVEMIRDYIREEITRARGKVVFKEVNTALGTATNGGGVASACLSLDKKHPAMITQEMYRRLQDWLGIDYLQRSYNSLVLEYEEKRAAYEKTRRPFDNQFNLSEVLCFSNEAAKTESKYDHETVKPETLTRALILTCSRKGDTVLIPFAGSGTECAMAAKERRNFIGFDIEQKHVDTANDRCRDHLTQSTIFDFCE